MADDDALERKALEAAAIMNIVRVHVTELLHHLMSGKDADDALRSTVRGEMKL